MKTMTAVLLGAGGRGMFTFGSHALEHPKQIRFVAVAEPVGDRRKQFAGLHKIEDSMCFGDWAQLLAKPRLADAAIICTQDGMHFEPAMAALEKGYHVLLEKPMSNDPMECITMGEHARAHGNVFSICHVLRYTPFFSTIKRLLDSGRIGKLISIQHNENVAHWHQAHSFVRGNWRNSAQSSPMILAKSCHDMDIMLWLAGADCTSISSFGSLTHFKKENAPPGAPLRCQDGCPAEYDCPYYAPDTYLKDGPDWHATIIKPDGDMQARWAELYESPYGRCVYHCDNDVVDHQVVIMEFSNEVTAAFTMCAFTKECTRTIKLMGTKGEIRGHMEKNEIEILDFYKESKEVITLSNPGHGHSGGDDGILREFVKLVMNNESAKSLTSADTSVQSHMMAFAAEKSRLTKKVVKLNAYVAELKMKD